MDEAGVVVRAVGAGRVHVSGELDALACERLAALLDDVQAPGARVVVDLSRATRLPLGALRCLAAAHRRLRDGGGAVVVASPSAAAVRALRTSGLDRVLEREDAGSPGVAAARTSA